MDEYGYIDDYNGRVDAESTPVSDTQPQVESMLPDMEAAEG